MAVLGGGGGGAGDTYTASTAVADIPVESGKSYALSSDGKLVPSDLIVTKRQALTVPASNVYGGSGYAYAFNVYGDMVTPDGKATFHFIGDNGNGNYGIFYISLDRGLTSNGPVMDSTTGNPFDRSIGWGGSTGARMYMRLLGEDDTYYYYTLFCDFYEASTSSTNYSVGRGIMVKKADYTFNTTGTDDVAGAQSPIWRTRTATNVSNYQHDHDYSRQSKQFFFTCRNKDIFVWTEGLNSVSEYGFVLNAVDTYRSSDSTYWGGTSMGLPKTSGVEQSNNTHRDNVTAQQHLPLFKVDDANGIFIAQYYAASGSNSGQHVFLKYTIAADHTITTSSEVLIGGTDPAQGSAAFGHWIATSNPLIYYYLYHDSGSSLYYTPCTWNSDWTTATWGTQVQLTLPIAMTDGYGTSNWANDYDDILMGVKHSVPEKELFFMTGNSGHTDRSALALSFPASGTPSVLGTVALNKVLDHSSADYNAMHMQSMNNGTMFSVQAQGGTHETYGYAIHYTDYWNPNFKKTTSKPAIARADGDIGDTVNIDLKTGDTATATLSSNFYLTKENMSYPLDSGDTSPDQPSVIKSIQRGIAYLDNNTQVGYAGANITISPVNTSKAFLNVSMGPTYNNVTSIGRGFLSGSNTITFNLVADNTAAYWNWEVIEYV